MRANLREAIEIQSRACAHLGAPFSAALLDHAAREEGEDGPVARLLAPWNDAPTDRLVRDAVALRLLASLHHLVLGGQAPRLAACYPPDASDPDRAWEAAREALAARPGDIASLLAHEPQTNEVRRSACLLGGFLTIGRETGLPLRCFELGASAGLNSLWDRFRYVIDERGQWGDPDSPVVLPCRWEGAAPPLATPLTVVERGACDRRPVDIGEDAGALRLLSYCWADQRERMARLRAAIGLARRAPVPVVDEPAAQWVRRAAPRAGTASVLFHSIVWQYIPPAGQAEIEAEIRIHAGRATPDAPFFWLRMEWDGESRRFELRLRSAPGWEDRLLAVVHPHGAFANWC
ncbi:MAG: DUF2332 domain-containing protein [Sphingobium sp.]